MYLMECAMGQFSQSSAVKVWKCSPIGQGVGYAMLTISLIVAIYYNVIIGTFCLEACAHQKSIIHKWLHADFDIFGPTSVALLLYIGCSRAVPMSTIV